MCYNMIGARVCSTVQYFVWCEWFCNCVPLYANWCVHAFPCTFVFALKGEWIYEWFFVCECLWYTISKNLSRQINLTRIALSCSAVAVLEMQKNVIILKLEFSQRVLCTFFNLLKILFLIKLPNFIVDYSTV